MLVQSRAAELDRLVRFISRDAFRREVRSPVIGTCTVRTQSMFQFASSNISHHPHATVIISHDREAAIRFSADDECLQLVPETFHCIIPIGVNDFNISVGLADVSNDRNADVGRALTTSSIWSLPHT